MDSELQDVADKMRHLHSQFKRYKQGGSQPNLTEAILEITAAVHSLTEYVGRIKSKTIGSRSV